MPPKRKPPPSEEEWVDAKVRIVETTLRYKRGSALGLLRAITTVGSDALIRQVDSGPQEEEAQQEEEEADTSPPSSSTAQRTTRNTTQPPQGSKKVTNTRSSTSQNHHPAPIAGHNRGDKRSKTSEKEEDLMDIEEEE